MSQDNGDDYNKEAIQEPPWYDDYAADEDPETQIDEYDLTATANDFNVLTIYNFIDSGAVKVPGFQRNYVWDLRRASKLIESLILGLPAPRRQCAKSAAEGVCAQQGYCEAVPHVVSVGWQ